LKKFLPQIVNPRKAVLWQILSGTLFFYIIFKTIEKLLLVGEGVLQYFPSPVFWMILAFITPLLSELVVKWLGKKPFSHEFVLELIFSACVVSLLVYVRQIPEFNFAPLEWHKIPQIFGIMFSGSYWFFIIMILYSLFLVAFLNLKISPNWTVALYFPLWLLALQAVCNQDQINERIFVFLLPLVAILHAIIFMARKRYFRILWEMLLASAFFSFIIFCYSGWIPPHDNESVRRQPFMEMLDLPEGAGPPANYSFIRALNVLHESGDVYFTYGPTSGIVRFHAADKTFSVYITHRMLLRHIQIIPEYKEVVAFEWIKNKFMRFDSTTLYLKSEKPMSDGDYMIPGNFKIKDGFLYLAVSQLPGMRKFSLPDMTTVAKINYNLEGYTKFRSGAWDLELHDTEPWIFAEIDYVNENNEASIVKLNSEDLRVIGSLSLKNAGDQIDLKYVPQIGRLLASTFFNDIIYEINPIDMSLVRRFEGAPNCRDLFYDPDRKLLYAISFFSGVLYVIDYNSERILGKVSLGNKVGSADYVTAEDKLYFGSSTGLGRIDIPKMLQALKINSSGS